MRQAYLEIAKKIKAARGAVVLGHKGDAARAFRAALEELKFFPPERHRDILLAHAYLGLYQTFVRPGEPVKLEIQEALHLGISYARSSRDPIARAIAQECLEGLDIAL